MGYLFYCCNLILQCAQNFIFFYAELHRNYTVKSSRLSGAFLLWLIIESFIDIELKALDVLRLGSLGYVGVDVARGGFFCVAEQPLRLLDVNICLVQNRCVAVPQTMCGQL